MSLQLKPVEIERAERIYTNEQFELMPEFYENYELVEGKLVERMGAGGVHSRIARQIERRITLFDPEEKIGYVFFDGTFNVKPGWMPVPDLAFVLLSRLPVINEKGLKVVPDLVVEIDSPSDLKTVKKREEAAKKIWLYQESGVKIIWSINPDTQIVKVYHPDQTEAWKILTLADELDGEDVIPNFKLKVADLFK